MDTEIMPSSFAGQYPGETGLEKPIGDIIREANNLSAEQVENILAYQRENNVKFGEAAVALGLANQDEVLWDEADAIYQELERDYPNTSASLQVPLMRADYYNEVGEADKSMTVLNEARENWLESSGRVMVL